MSAGSAPASAEDVVERIMPRLKALETDQEPLLRQGRAEEGGGVHWVRPELVAEIQSAPGSRRDGT